MDRPKCPCCGAPVDPLEVLPDAGRSQVTYGGATAQLTRRQFELFSALHGAYPRIVSKDALYDILFAMRRDPPQPKTLDIMVCQSRKKLTPIGLVITTAHGVGYGLTVTTPDVAEVVQLASQAVHLRQVASDRTLDEPIRLLTRQGESLTSIARTLSIGYAATWRAMNRLGLLHDQQSGAP